MKQHLETAAPKKTPLDPTVAGAGEIIPLFEGSMASDLAEGVERGAIASNPRQQRAQDDHATDPADDSQKFAGHSWDPWAALMEALVEAVLTLPEFEKKQVIDQSMAPLFEALLTLPTIPRIAGIWWLLTACGYPDYAKRLVLLGANFSEKAPAVPPASSVTTPKLEEAQMSRKRARRTAVRRSRRKNAVRRPGNAQLALLVIDQVAAPASTPGDLAKRLDRDWFRTHPQRSHRLRNAIAGEFPGAPLERYVVVRQVQPGARLRQPFDMAAPLPHDEAPEHIAHAIYDLLQEYRGRIIPDQELFRRISAYAVGADPEDFSHDKPLRWH